MSARPTELRPRFEGVSETLLITLAARATADRLHPDLRFDDPRARDFAARIGFDPRRFTRDVFTMRGVVLRARLMDDRVRDFLRRRPGARVVALGAGLDTRFQRVDDGRVRWTDVDLPPVVDTLRRLVEPCDRHRLLAGSIQDGGWLDGLADGGPVLLVVEGVLMYLSPADVRRFFVRAGRALPPGSELLFDFIHPVMAWTARVHPSVRKTRGRFRWGVRRPETVTRWAPEWTLVERVNYMPRFPRVVGVARLRAGGRRTGTGRR